ncbi:MAG: DNA internalization-related competence protein ComEC/Rec2 [Thermodesulfobacteriota bacterium]
MRPLLPVLIAFIAGILCASALEFSYGYAFALLALSVVPAVFLFLRGRRFSRLSGSLPFFALGVLFLIPYARPELPESHIRNLIGSGAGQEDGVGFASLGTVVEGVAASAPRPAGTRTRLYVDAGRVFKGGVWTPATGRIYLTVEGRPPAIAPGDRLRFVAALTRPWNFGNPGEFDYRGWLAARGVYVKGYVKSPRLMVRLGEGRPSAARLLYTVRARIGAAIDASGAANPGLLKALITGGRDGIDPQTEEAFKATGTAHILAISGLHIGIVSVFSYWFFLFLLKRSERLMLAMSVKKAALLLSLGPALAYALVSGLATSTQRAVVMIFAFVLTYAFGRGRDYVNTLCLAALLILAVSPLSLREASFQLTFAAVMGIVYLVPKFQKALERDEEDGPIGKGRRRGRLSYYSQRFFRNRCAIPFFATLAAGLATAPIIAFHFHRASLVGLAANMAVVPLGTVAIPLLLLSALFIPVWQGAAYALMNASGLVVGLMASVVEAFARLPYSSLWVTTPTLLEISLFYVALFLAANLRKGRRYAWAAAMCAALLTANVVYWQYFNTHDGELRVTFISVGQGDSALVELPGGKTMLVDGGGRYGSGFDIGEAVVAPLLWYKKIKKIDYMVLSHAQLDHMGGLGFIARNFKVGEFWWNGMGSLRGLGRTLDRGGVRRRIISSRGLRVEDGGVSIEAFRPYTDPEGLDLNNMSVVLRLRYGATSLLLAGDIAGAGEAAAVASGRITADVLKAPHHGSRSSSSAAFIEAVAPSLVVVSAGRGNPFGFPHPETLARYTKAGARVLRTDTGGAVTVKTNGRAIAAGAWLTDGAW